MRVIRAHRPRRPTCRCCDGILLHFAQEELHVYPTANVPKRLAAQLAAFVREAIENPSIIPALATGAASPRVRRQIR